MNINSELRETIEDIINVIVSDYNITKKEAQKALNKALLSSVIDTELFSQIRFIVTEKI